MSREDPEIKSSFVVRDRRRFESDGTPRAGEEQKEKEKQAPPSSAPAAAPASSFAPDAPRDSAPALPLEAEFSSLLLSLAASAQTALGLGAPGAKANLKQAKHFVDLIGMLENKTRGNLSAEEAELLQALLYELRMAYVSVSGGKVG